MHELYDPRHDYMIQVSRKNTKTANSIVNRSMYTNLESPPEGDLS